MKLKEFMETEDSFSNNKEADKIISDISSLFEKLLNKTSDIMNNYKTKMENDELDRKDLEQLKHIKDELNQFIINLNNKKNYFWFILIGV